MKPKIFTLIFFLVALVASNGFAQAPTISYASPQAYIINSPIATLKPTVSSVGAPGYKGPATVARVSAIGLVATDPAGDIFLTSDAAGGGLMSYSPAGIETHFYTSRNTSHPMMAIAADAAGNVYLAQHTLQVMKYAPGSSAGVAIGPVFGNPTGIAVDAAGNVYVAAGGHNIIKIPADGSALVGVCTGLTSAYDVAIDGSGNVYVEDSGIIKKFRSGGAAPFVALNSTAIQTGPFAVDATGDVFYMGTTPDNSIQGIAGEVFEISAGVTTLISTSDTYYEQTGIAVNGAGIVYIGNQAFSMAGNGGGGALLKITPTGGYNIDKALPAGLSFNETNGDITGTPTVASPATDYTVTAYNATAGTSAVVNIQVKANNANLAGLQLSNGTLSPVFAAGTLNYSTAVGNTLTTMTVTPTVADATATVTVNGAAVTSGTASAPIPLTVGANTVNITVTAQDGVTTKTYILTVNQAKSQNADLSAIALSSGAVSPVFVPANTGYTAVVDNGVSSITVTPTVSVATSTVKVNGIPVTSGSPSAAIPLVVGSNAVTIPVTAQDGAVKTYTVTVTRSSLINVSLSSLTASAGTLTPGFSPGITSYDLFVGNMQNSMTFTPTAADANATIKLNGTPVTSGSASAFLPLTVGVNTFSLVVTGSDGTTTRTYTLTVHEAQSENNFLASLTTSAGLMQGLTVPLSITENVPDSVSSITVTATTRDNTATMAINGSAVTSGSPSAAIALGAGANTITIVVTAQDTRTLTYILTVNRASGLAGDNAVYQPVSVDKPADRPQLAEDGVAVHQAVSPNGDGINDYLIIDNIANYPDNKLAIMGQNGTLVFEAKGYDNVTKTFDGHSNKTGQMQLPGTYFYSLDYTVNGIIKHKTGYLVLKY